MNRKKAVSPVVSTVLLVMIVIIIAVIIVVWLSSFYKEAITKEIAGQKKTVDQFCTEIKIKAFANENDGSFGVNNNGNIPIYGYALKLIGAGTSRIEKKVGKDWNTNPGFQKTFTSPDYRTYEKVLVIPILLGKTKSGSVNEFQCPEENGVQV